MKKLYLFLSLLVVATMLLASCGAQPTPTAVATEPPATEPPATEEPVAALGTFENPIHIIYVPSVDAATIVAGGDLLHAALHDATGLFFKVSVPTSYAATIEELCASPDNTMAFIPGLGYALANQLCGATVGAKAVRFGLDWYAAMIFVKRDSEIQSLADLNGLKWAYPDAASTSGYMYPLYMLTQAGVVPSESFAAGNHDSAVRAVYNGEADFGTAFWSPANVDGVSLGVTLGADALLNPDVPVELVDSCVVTEDGKQVLCENYEVRDARRNLRAEAPDVVQQVRILAVTPAIPNDTLTFGPGFPADVRDAILNALFAFATDDPDGFKAAFSAYSWTSILPATDAEYDELRLAIQNSGYSLEDMK